jgi:hypothetical protein
MLPPDQTPPVGTELPDAICAAVRDWLQTGKDAGKFIIRGEDVGAVKAEQPAYPLRGKFPQVYVVWSSATPVDAEVCYPQVTHIVQVVGQVRVYLQELNPKNRVNDTRNLSWAIYKHLRLSRALGGLVLDFTVGRVSGDTESLARQGISAHGVVEFSAKAIDSFDLEAGT